MEAAEARWSGQSFTDPYDRGDILISHAMWVKLAYRDPMAHQAERAAMHVVGEELAIPGEWEARRD